MPQSLIGHVSLMHARQHKLSRLSSQINNICSCFIWPITNHWYDQVVIDHMSYCQDGFYEYAGPETRDYQNFSGTLTTIYVYFVIFCNAMSTVKVLQQSFHCYGVSMLHNLQVFHIWLNQIKIKKASKSHNFSVQTQQDFPATVTFNTPLTDHTFITLVLSSAENKF